MTSIPEIWRGEECFILGGGPSLGNVNLSRLRGKCVIAVNNAYELGPWPVLLYGDCNWWRSMTNSAGVGHCVALRAWGGLKIHPCQHSCQHRGSVVVQRRDRGYGVSRRADALQWNLSSGGCAIDLAVKFGVRRVVLLGFDMSSVQGKHNWHAAHGPRSAKFNPYPRHLLPFASIARDLDALGIECVNATPGSAIINFPMIDPEAVL